MSGNDRAIAALDRLRARIVELGSTAEEIAPEAAKEIQGILAANIAAGRAPDGTGWQRTQAGDKPLQSAAKALEVKADGTRIVATLSGPEALHHLGWARGGIVRQILPNRDQLGPWILAIKRAIAKHVARSGGG